MTPGVLIVDDDQFIRKLIATTLEDVSEFELHEAADGVEALEVAQRETRPRLVFLDVDMPRLNGIEACRQLRAGDTSGNLTIVMLTAASGDNVESDAEAGRRRPVPDQAVQPAGPAAPRRSTRRAQRPLSRPRLPDSRA